MMPNESRPSDRIPLDKSLLEHLGRAQWAAARLHHVIRDRNGQLRGEISDDPFTLTLGQAVNQLKETATKRGRQDIVDWCEKTGKPALEDRNGLTHAIAFTAGDGAQALRGSTPDRPSRYQAAEILDIADRLVVAAGLIPAA